MKKITGLFCTIVLLLSVFSHAEASPRQERLAGPITVKVLRVVDGDTVEVRAHVWIGEEIDTSVRFAGIDAPELHSRCAKEYKMAHAAKDEISRLLSNNLMTISNIR